jgi:hypothetical protein
MKAVRESELPQANRVRHPVGGGPAIDVRIGSVEGIAIYSALEPRSHDWHTLLMTGEISKALNQQRASRFEERKD